MILLTTADLHKKFILNTELNDSHIQKTSFDAEL